MSRAAAAPPAPLDPRSAGLGALDPALHRLAQLQGGWPPRAPQLVRQPHEASALAQGAAADTATEGHAAPASPLAKSAAADAATESHAAPASALAQGAAAADAAADEGVDLLVVDPDGPEGTALAAVAALLGLEPVAAVGTSGGPTWAPLLAEVRDGLRAARPHAADPEALLAALDDPELAHTVGLLSQAALRCTPVLLGSSPTAVAGALVAEKLTPGTHAWLLAGCSPAAPGARRVLDDLALVPLLDLGLPGAGGALLAQAVLAAALELLAARA